MSPILKLYVQDKPDFQFLKPVEVMLPHYLDLTSEDDSLNLGVEFLRTGHAMSSNQMYEFQQIESNKEFLRTMLGFCTPITSALWPKYDHNM